MPEASGAVERTGRRVVLVRHGETEWSRNGRHTSTTDLPLLPEGVEHAYALSAVLDPAAFAEVAVSPRRRARETATLAGFPVEDRLDPSLVEWDYGEYEGLTTPEIRRRDPDWDIWRDGCPGGESAAEVSARADALIERLRGGEGVALLFAHGHFLRVLAVRWLGAPLELGRQLRLSPASVSGLGWEHDTPAIEFWNARPGALRALS